MTTIDIHADTPFAASFRPASFDAASATPARATRLRLTVRGRRVLAFLASVPAVIAVSIAIVSGGGALASGEGSAPAATFVEVTVMPGDTLWSIAEEVAPGADPRDVVDAIMRLNALPSGSLTAGQALALPTEYAPQH